MKRKEVGKLRKSGHFGPHSVPCIRNSLCRCFGFTGLDRNTTPMYTLHLHRESQKLKYGLREKHHLSLPKMFKANFDRCPVSLSKLYSLKCALVLRDNCPYQSSPILRKKESIQLIISLNKWNRAHFCKI